MFKVCNCFNGDYHGSFATYAQAYAECLRLAGMTKAPEDGFIGFYVDGVDAYYCELVDVDGNREWSDVIHDDIDPESVADAALHFAGYELSDATGMKLRLYPISLANPVFEREL